MRSLLSVTALLLAPLAARAADQRVGLQPAYGSPTHNVVESVSPPVIERGKTTRVTFLGKDFGPGLDVWCSLPKGELTAKPVTSETDKLVFDITASADAPVGVCGLRVATSDGLTNAVLFHVEDLPVVRQSRGDKPMALALPACVQGTFLEGTLDRYAIAVAAGERVSFEAVANRLGKDADPLLTIRDADGKFVAERDNDPGLYFDFRFAHTFAKAGTYTLEIRDARLKASEHHHYLLRVGKFPVERVAVPTAVADASRLPGAFFTNAKRPGDHGSTWLPVTTAEGPITVARDLDESRDSALAQATSGPAQLAFLLAPTRANPFQPLDRMLVAGRLQATPATVPGVLCGVLKKPGQRQAFAVKLDKGQRVFLRTEAKALNSPADLEVTITDRAGRELRRSNETRDGDITLDFTANTPGEYGIVVRDALRDGSGSHAYRLTVRSEPFPPTLTAEVEGLTIPRDNYQHVPIVVTRTGTPGPIKLSLVGAPDGLRLSPAEIPETASTIVCTLEADAGTALGVHTVQIVAQCGSEKVLVRTRPLIDKKLQNIDLIPIALREDQTRLPPSLTDRFAVQITPPAPFTFELPETLVTLPRYQTAPVPVVTTRVAGFAQPITFTAVGGQLTDKNEGRTRVYAEFPEATAKQPKVSGVVVSKILSNTTKARIDVSATTVDVRGRITLTRSFDLDLVTAFRFAPASAKLALLPGESATVKVTVERLKAFDGPVTVHLNPMQGLEHPETVMVPKGQASVEFAVKALADAQPRKQGWNATATGEVSGFEEEVRGQVTEIEIKKVEVPKKK
jgi:hypothetical protein